MEIINQLKNIINKSNPLIIEIGCWNGRDTQLFLKHFPLCKIFAFEPDPRNIKMIKNNIVDTRLLLIEEAISDEDGEAIFYDSHGITNGEKDWSASGSLNKPKRHLHINPHIKFGNGIKVITKKLDTITKKYNLNEIDLIWADVNGAEYKMIQGATESLKKTKYLYTEFSEDGIYENCLTKQKIKEILPNFKELFTYRNNILMENILLFT